MKLILDANNLAYRAWSTTTLTTKSGENVSAIYGSLQMIQSYLKPSAGKYKNKLLDAVSEYLGETREFDTVVACWDFGKSKTRMEIFPDYKRQREDKKAEQTEEERAAFKQFIDQMDQLHHNLPHFGVKSLKVRGWEGDDLMYVVTKLLPEDSLCVLVSTDKDMLQLVSDRVLVWSPFRETLYTPKNFLSATGVTQKSYLSYRVLVGDSSDNINGVSGVGEKTAKDLVTKFGDLEGILKAKPLLMKSKRTARIFEDLSLLKRNLQLMDLSYVPVDEVRDHVEEVLNAETKFDDRAVKQFLLSKQFVSIMSDFVMWSRPFRVLS